MELNTNKTYKNIDSEEAKIFGLTAGLRQGQKVLLVKTVELLNKCP